MRTYQHTPEPARLHTPTQKKEQNGFFRHLQPKDPPGGAANRSLLYEQHPAAVDNTYVKKPIVQPLNLGWDPRPTVGQAAEMAQDVYNDYGKRTEISGGWMRLPSFYGIKLENEKLGFQSAVYCRHNPYTGKVAYVFSTAGTDPGSGRDWLEDALQPLGLSEQYAFSIKTALLVNQRMAPDESLTFTGHSLGGGTAAANAMATGRQAITFNAAGVSALTKRKHKLSSENNDKNIKAFIIPGEAVDYYQQKIGSTADGKHIYVHPLLGRMNSWTAAAAKKLPQTVFVRAYLHTMGQMMSALEESGYK